MIQAQTVVNRVKAETGYNVQLARSADQDLLDIDSGVVVSIGYGAIRSENPEKNIAYDFYQVNAENVIQSFYIVICCSPDVFHTVFNKVYKALIAWNPVTTEAAHTSFTYSNGEPLGFNNAMFLFRQEWKIGFPTNQLLT